MGRAHLHNNSPNSWLGLRHCNRTTPNRKIVQYSGARQFTRSPNNGWRGLRYSILGEIMRQILLKEVDCNPLNDTLSFNAMAVAGVLNICMCVSAYLTRRNFRFI